MKRLLPILAVLTAAILLCSIFAMPAAADDTDTSGYAAEVVRLVNSERAKAGLPALAANIALSNAAQKRSQELFVTFKHTRPDGRDCFTIMQEYNVTYSRAAENIAYGQKTPEDVMAAWMKSSGHKANILGDYTRIGVGVYEKNGTIYWTQLFINPGSRDDSNFFVRMWNWIVSAWNRAAGFFCRLLGF